jgi:general secretion pathway protein D
MALFNNNQSAWALCVAAPLVAMVSTATYAQTWKINLRDADLAAFINEVADITGKNFAVDPRVRGNVTVISNRALNRAEVYDLFLIFKIELLKLNCIGWPLPICQIFQGFWCDLSF